MEEHKFVICMYGADLHVFMMVDQGVTEIPLNPEKQEAHVEQEGQW